MVHRIEKNFLFLKNAPKSSSKPVSPCQKVFKGPDECLLINKIFCQNLSISSLFLDWGKENFFKSQKSLLDFFFKWEKEGSWLLKTESVLINLLHLKIKIFFVKVIPKKIRVKYTTQTLTRKTRFPSKYSLYSKYGSVQYFEGVQSFEQNLIFSHVHFLGIRLWSFLRNQCP